MPRLRVDQIKAEEAETFLENTLTTSRKEPLLHIKATALISCRETSLSRSRSRSRIQDLPAEQSRSRICLIGSPQ